jgi:hypothetical protein
MRAGLKEDLGIGKNNPDRPKKERVVKEKKAREEKVERGNQKNLADIIIYRTKKPTRPYDEVGTVKADRYSAFSVLPVAASDGKIEKKLKEQAVKLGADAIIITSSDVFSTQGVAIVFTDKEKPVDTPPAKE